MEKQKNHHNGDVPEGLILYFNSRLLGIFHSQPDRYHLQTDEFWGHVESLDGNPSILAVDFGFRACKNGDWAIAAWGPDLQNASEVEQKCWSGFRLPEEELQTAEDLRFRKWISRYVDGNWDVEDGPIARLDELVQHINALSLANAHQTLFNSANIRNLCFPAAENNHRYHDAHSELYKNIIDTLNMDTIRQIGNTLQADIKTNSNRTVNALMHLLPEGTATIVSSAFQLISDQRRNAAHKPRQSAEPFPAFETFGRDLEQLIRGMKALRDSLSEQLDLDVESCQRHVQALNLLPDLNSGRSIASYASIHDILRMEGMKVTNVRVGHRRKKQGKHESEALVLKLSDGGQLGIETLTNIGQLIASGGQIAADALRVSFQVTYVPPLRPSKNRMRERANEYPSG